MPGRAKGRRPGRRDDQKHGGKIAFDAGLMFTPEVNAKHGKLLTNIERCLEDMAEVTGLRAAAEAIAIEQAPTFFKEPM
jgi:hypothetical protein